MTREEALQAIQEKMDYYESDKRLRGAIETLVPELSEIEDERIRKIIYNCVYECCDTGYLLKDDRNSVVAWLEKQKENPKTADSIPPDCTSDAKCEDRWHKVSDSLPDNPREVLCKDEAGNYFIGRYYTGEGWEISNYDDEDKPHHLNPPVSKWIDFPSEKQKERKSIKMEVYEVGKGTTVCGQDYKCKKDYKEGNCWYIKDVVYHCSRDGYLTDQDGVSWSCTPEWFNEYIYTNNELADKEKNDFVSGQFLQCKVSFDEFKEGEHYWLEYVGDDMYVGRSDNILNQKFHITPRQLYTLFSQQFEEVQGPPQEEKQVSLNYEPPFNENPSDNEIIEALIKNLKEQDGFLTAIDCVSCKAILIWLEKQKEQKPVEKPDLVAELKHHLATTPKEQLEKEWKELERWNNIGPTVQDFLYGKPVEWSEEDERMLWEFTAWIPEEELAKHNVTRNDILEKLKSLRSQPIQLKEAYKDGFQTARHAMALAFMNYLDENRPDGKMGLSNGECEDIDEAFKKGDWAKIMRYAEKYSPQPKQEWSEEDEEKINNISEIIEYCTNIPYSGGTLTLNKEYKKELLCFIKSLRHSWKPSEEQMKALKEVAYNIVGTGTETDVYLVQLYEQLKKLM